MNFFSSTYIQAIQEIEAKYKERRGPPSEQRKKEGVTMSSHMEFRMKKKSLPIVTTKQKCDLIAEVRKNFKID